MNEKDSGPGLLRVLPESPSTPSRFPHATSALLNSSAQSIKMSRPPLGGSSGVGNIEPVMISPVIAIVTEPSKWLTYLRSSFSLLTAAGATLLAFFFLAFFATFFLTTVTRFFLPLTRCACTSQEIPQATIINATKAINNFLISIYITFLINLYR